MLKTSPKYNPSYIPQSKPDMTLDEKEYYIDEKDPSTYLEPGIFEPDNFEPVTEPPISVMIPLLCMGVIVVALYLKK